MFTFKTQKQKTFSLAWKNARYAAKHHGGSPREYFAESLKLAYRGIELETIKPRPIYLTSSFVSAVIMVLLALASFGAGVLIGETAAIIFMSIIATVIGVVGWSDYEDHKVKALENKRINNHTNFELLTIKF